MPMLIKNSLAILKSVSEIVFMFFYVLVHIILILLISIHTAVKIHGVQTKQLSRLVLGWIALFVL